MSVIYTTNEQLVKEFPGLYVLANQVNQSYKTPLISPTEPKNTFQKVNFPTWLMQLPPVPSEKPPTKNLSDETIRDDFGVLQK